LVVPARASKAACGAGVAFGPSVAIATGLEDTIDTDHDVRALGNPSLVDTLPLDQPGAGTLAVEPRLLVQAGALFAHRTKWPD
jgi:hypothetical protein